VSRYSNWLVSLVVTPRDSAATLEHCLTSLHHQTYLDTEIIVVDNFSRDGGAAVSRRLADRFISAGPDQQEQRRRGLALARGNVVAFVDADAYYSAEVVAQARRAFDSQAIDAVAAPEHTAAAGSLAPLRRLASRRRRRRHSPAQLFRTDALRRLAVSEPTRPNLDNTGATTSLLASGYRMGTIRAPILRFHTAATVPSDNPRFPHVANGSIHTERSSIRGKNLPKTTT
jgi:glycosyltransferase involved in cell wall biosynthesis